MRLGYLVLARACDVLAVGWLLYFHRGWGTKKPRGTHRCNFTLALKGIENLEMVVLCFGESSCSPSVMYFWKSNLTFNSA